MKAPLLASSVGMDSAPLDTGLGIAGPASPNKQDFAPLFQQARATASDGFAVVPPATADVESLAQQLQALPQAGKLLPLLAQALDQASARGVDPRRLVERLSAQLEQLQSTADTNPASALSATLHQYLDEMPAFEPQATAQQAVVLTAGAKTSTAALAGQRPDGRPFTRPLVAQTEVSAAGGKPLSNDSLTEFTTTATRQAGLDQALEQVQQRPTEPASPLTTMLKRLMAGSKSAASETPLRAESAMASVPVPTAQGSAPPTSVLPTLSVNTPLAQAGWGQALGERIQWLVSRDLQGAQIKLNPAQLGPLEVRIQVQNDQASIQFSSAHGVVREALEAALPRLRDLFDASGVELVDVDVSGQSFAREQATSGEDGVVAGETRRTDTGGGEDRVPEQPVSSMLAGGRLDLFA